MQNWQKEYHRNFGVGIIISLAVHCMLFFLIYIFSKLIPSNTSSDYYYTPYISHLTVFNVGKVVPESGGSFGEKIDLAKELSNKNLIAGIPVPGAESTNVEYAMKTQLTNKKDSSSAPGSNEYGARGRRGLGDGEGNAESYGFGRGLGSGFRQLPFMPRQILEVLPEKIEDAKGMIVLALRIGLDGSVKENKVILNTVNNADCLKYVLEAAYKSKWEKIKMEGQQIEYWIEKTYRLN